MTAYLTSARKQFEYYKLRGEQTMQQLPDEAPAARPDFQSGCHE